VLHRIAFPVVSVWYQYDPSTSFGPMPLELKPAFMTSGR
jgi:hypothetical protein